jgi:hypothetical protein
MMLASFMAAVPSAKDAQSKRATAKLKGTRDMEGAGTVKKGEAAN